MRFEQVTSPLGRFGIKAIPHDYDGTPRIDGLWFDSRPKNIHPDHLALACFLAFSPYIAGSFDTGIAFSPATAEAIQRYSSSWMTFPRIELYPKALPLGEASLQVVLDTSVDAGDARESRDCPVLHFARSDVRTGWTVSRTMTSTSSNAWLHCAGSSPLRRLEVTVACALLFAEDISAGELVVDASSSETEIVALRELLSAGRLGLVVTSSDTRVVETR